MEEEVPPEYTPRYIAVNSDGENKIVPIPESDESGIFTPEKHDANPLIFYRLGRPLKADKELPNLDLSKYFKKSVHHGLKLKIIPDYTYDVLDQVSIIFSS